MKPQVSKLTTSMAATLVIFGVNTASAAPSGPTVLVKKVTTTYQTGKQDTFNCAIHTDGVVTERSIAGVLI